MTSVHLRAHVDRATLKEGEPIPFIAATEGRKADGLDLKMDRLRLDRFTKNPIIGYGHDYWGRDSLPIGRSVDTAVDGPALRMRVEFDAGDEFAMTVDRKVRGGYLNTMSVGFDLGSVDNDGVPDWWELFESSVVPLPMDPDAVAERAMRTLRRLGFAATLESRAVRMAMKVHHTPTVDETWDGPAQVAAASGADQLRYMHAWMDDEGDPEAKSSYKFPHHAAGTDSAANLAACRNGLARLEQADIPDDDRAAVEAHLRAHLDDGDAAANAADPVETNSSDEEERARRLRLAMARRPRILDAV